MSYSYKEDGYIMNNLIKELKGEINLLLVCLTSKTLLLIIGFPLKKKE